MTVVFKEVKSKGIQLNRGHVSLSSVLHAVCIIRICISIV